jgi:quinone-modifying oxidoreductase, subunit QmoB
MAKVAVLFCESCKIGSALDLAALEKVAAKCEGVCKVKSAPLLCGEGGAKVMEEGLAAGANALVVVACAARFHTDAFTRVGCHTERVSLRELVVGSHEPNQEDTQMLAEDMVRMGAVRASRVELPKPEPLPAERSVLVVGGGPSGMAAALGVARAGYKAVLVEREPELGGWLRTWKRTLPTRLPYRDLQVGELDRRRKEVEAHPRVEVRCGTTLKRVSGQPGQFDVDMKVGEEDVTTRVGAIVQATGFRPYDAAKLTHLGYGRSPDVITSVELERMLARGEVRRPSDGNRPGRIAFVQCAGSRDPQHLPYCSNVCCRVTLKQALWLRELDSSCEAFVLAKEIRTPGLHEDFYRRAQEDPGIFITKGEVASVEASGKGLVVELSKSQLGDEVELEADLVVLAVGMVPVATDGVALRELKDARRNLERGDGDAARLQATVDRLSPIEGTEILGLTYRQGPDLPALEYGFPDSHFICFPYETRRTGIYAAGCARAPGDMESCRIDGEGAALKAIQVIEHCAAGEAVHPRWGDVSPPTFNLQRCTQCKRCTEECPFGTLDEDEKATPKPNPGRCRRCGICLGACPERIISYADYSIDIVSRMIKSIEVPDEFEEKPRILMLLCENDAYPALELAGFHGQRYSPFVRAISVRCLGAVNVVWLADAFARGFDGVLLLGCKPGEQTQCHYTKGSELLATRSENIKQKLKQMALEDQRVRVEHVTLSDYVTLPKLIDDFVKQVDALGPNPFKDS